MWIRKQNRIVNTDNVCSIYQQSDKVIFRFAGTSSPSVIERGPLSAECVMKGMPEGTIDKVWKALSEEVSMLCL
jgi:hypothetical protein